MPGVYTAQKYRELAQAVMAIDPTARIDLTAPAIPFAIDQLEERLEQLKAQKSAAEARAPEEAALARYRHLYMRHHAANQQIIEQQAVVKDREHQFRIIGIPEALQAAPEGVPEHPAYQSVADLEQACDSYAIIVSAAEKHALDLRARVLGYLRLEPEARNLKLLLAIADRLERLENSVSGLTDKVRK